VDAERLTRLDRILIAERGDEGILLRPGEGQSYLVRENRYLLIGQAKSLERFGLTLDTEPGRWFVASRTEEILKALGERNDIIKTGSGRSPTTASRRCAASISMPFTAAAVGRR
jgi:type IV secretory pathway VirD2 relaxase